MSASADHPPTAPDALEPVAGATPAAPSPTLAELQELDARWVLPTYARLPIAPVSGSGAWLRDADGRAILDALCGIAVTSLGHQHPAITAAVQEQAGRLLHGSNLTHLEGPLRLARRLAEGSLGGAVFFTNSGAEANEAAIKLARRHRRGGEIVSVHGAFHGRTYGALSATPQESKQEPFAPLVPGFRAVPPTAGALREAVTASTAAVLLEAIQGESGVHVLSDEVLRAAREACDAAGALLILDEVQTGVGRTGTLWRHQATGVVPDAMTSAKALGGGMPIGALIVGEHLRGTLQPGDHGSTFAGGPLVAAAAHAVLDVVEAPGFLERVTALGERLRTALAALDGIGEVRGAGLMIGADLEPDAAERVGGAPALVRRLALEHGLLVNATGPTTLRLLPPLTITDDELALVVDRLAAGLARGPRAA